MTLEEMLILQEAHREEATQQRLVWLERKRKPARDCLTALGFIGSDGWILMGWQIGIRVSHPDLPFSAYVLPWRGEIYVLSAEDLQEIHHLYELPFHRLVTDCLTVLEVMQSGT